VRPTRRVVTGPHERVVERRVSATTMSLADLVPPVEVPDPPLVFVDTETDGTHPDRQVWEFGAVRRDPDGQVTTYQAFLPIDLSRVTDRYALGVGKFHDRHPYGRYVSQLPTFGLDPAAAPYAVADLVPADEVALAAARMMHGAVVIGATPSFDTEALDRLLRAHGLLGMWDYRLADVSTLAAGFLIGRGQRPPLPWSSGKLAAALGVAPVDEQARHTVLGDIEFGMRIWDAVHTAAPSCCGGAR
jgi:hypothetical protein